MEILEEFWGGDDLIVFCFFLAVIGSKRELKVVGLNLSISLRRYGGSILGRMLGSLGLA